MCQAKQHIITIDVPVIIALTWKILVYFSIQGLAELIGIAMLCFSKIPWEKTSWMNPTQPSGCGKCKVARITRIN